MLSNTPILYNHAELNAPAKPVVQETVQPAPSYEAVLYMCGEAML
jgi:hypothetical protein